MPTPLSRKTAGGHSACNGAAKQAVASVGKCSEAEEQDLLPVDILRTVLSDALRQQLHRLQEMLQAEVAVLRNDLRGLPATPHLQSHFQQDSVIPEASAPEPTSPVSLSGMRAIHSVEYNEKHRTSKVVRANSSTSQDESSGGGWKRTSRCATADGPTALTSGTSADGQQVAATDSITSSTAGATLSFGQRLEEVEGRGGGVVASKIAAIVEWGSGFQEPTRTGCGARIIYSQSFEVLCIVVIFFNSILIAYTADWEMSNLDEKVPQNLTTMEYCCGAFFAIELLLRLYVHRFYFFVNSADMKMNIFDFCIVMMTSLDFLREMNDGAAEEEGSNWTMMRIMRLVKVAKVFRAVKAFRFFKDLVLILESLKASLSALFWILIMLGIMLYVFALIFFQAMIEYVNTHDSPAEMSKFMQDGIDLHFNSVIQSMLSLYMSITGGVDWIVHYEIVAKAGNLYAILFVLFTFFFLFALLNILTGLFVEKATFAAKPTFDDLVRRHQRRTEQDVNQLRLIWQIMDLDHSKDICVNEFETMMQDPTMVAYMASLGLEVHEPRVFFSMMCKYAGSKNINIDAFVDSCMFLKGAATSVEAHRHCFELQMLQHDLRRLATDVRNLGVTCTMSRTRELETAVPKITKVQEC